MRVLYITSGKFKERKKKDHTQKVIDVESRKLRREPGRGGGSPGPLGVQSSRPRAAQGQEGLGALGSERSEPSPTPAAIHLHPAAEYDNVSIFHFPDVTINKAMIQKGLC